MKVMVTGAGGQLGRALLARAPAGLECVALARPELDFHDRQAIRRMVAHHAPDLILNAAAYTAVDRAESDQAAAFAINCHAVEELADGARACGAHLVQISSDFVFDGATSQAYLPHDPRNPLSVYGRSKCAGEDAAGPGASIVRTSWVYAAGGINFVHTMLKLMQSQDQVGVIADQIGAPTWATGLADIVWSIGMARLAGTWHFSDAGVASWYDLAVAVQEEALALGLLKSRTEVLPIRSSQYITPARRPRFSLLDSSHTFRVLRKTPVHWRANLRAMLGEVLATT